MRDRLKVPPAPEVVKHLVAPAVSGDGLALFGPIMQINKAHVAMLARQGIVDRAVAGAILRHLAAIEEAGVGALELRPDLEDLYFNIEAELLRRAGPEVGGQMHTGRSRNDLYAAAIRLWVRETLAPGLGDLLRLREELLTLAASHLETVMSAYTHLQPAQPTTLAHYLAGIIEALGRDATRLVRALETVNRSPLGACATVGTGFPISREQTAEWLGFAGLVENAIDAVASRDYLVDALAALAMWATTMSRFAHDLYVWSTDEFGGIAVPDAAAFVSSIMPQKKNPIALEHVKAKAAHVQAALLATLGCMKNTPFGHSRDINVETLRPFPAALRETLAACDLLRCTLRGLEVDRETWRTRTARNFSTMTELADLLVREHGLSFRTAHRLVSTLVNAALARGLRADGIDLALVEAAAEEVLGRPLGMAAGKLRQALDPLESVRSHAGPGGPAPWVVAQALEQLQQENRVLAEGLRTLTDRWQAASATLQREADALIVCRGDPA